MDIPHDLGERIFFNDINISDELYVKSFGDRPYRNIKILSKTTAKDGWTSIISDHGFYGLGTSSKDAEYHNAFYNKFYKIKPQKTLTEIIDSVAKNQAFTDGFHYRIMGSEPDQSPINIIRRFLDFQVL